MSSVVDSKLSVGTDQNKIASTHEASEIEKLVRQRTSNNWCMNGGKNPLSLKVEPNEHFSSNCTQSNTGPLLPNEAGTPNSDQTSTKKKQRKHGISSIPSHLKPPSNASLQRSISADTGSLARPRRDSRLLNRRQSHYQFDPRKLVEAKRQAGFWQDPTWNPLVHLKFRDADDEKAFCKLYREKGRRILRVWCAVLIFLPVAALVWRPPLISLSSSFWFSLCVVQFLFNLGYGIVINSALWCQMRIQLITMTVLCVNVFTCCIYAALLKRFPDSAISLMLIGYASMRLRLSYSLIVGLLTTVFCNLLYMVVSKEPWSTLLFVNIHLLASNVIGAVTGYFLEKRERVHFFDLYTYYEDCSLVEFEKLKIDFLLKAAIPPKFIERLPHGNPAEKYNSVSVAFVCLDNVIQYTDKRNSEESIRILNELFRVCEARSQQFGCEKIKTIQDKFMVLCGAPEPQPDHAIILADMILAIVQDFKEIQETPEFQHKYPGLRLNIRVGMSSGPIVAGVIGVKRFCWDIWGDTVNVASRMEDPKNGEPRCSAVIRISSSSMKLLEKTHKCLPASKIYVKGKGEMETFLLEGRISSRLKERRPSEPRDNQLPEYRAFSWDQVEEVVTPESETMQSQEDIKFKNLYFKKILPNTRIVMTFVGLVYSAFGLAYLLIPSSIPRVVFIVRFAGVLPFWMTHLLFSFSTLYTMEVSAMFNCISLLSMVVCTVISQLLIHRGQQDTIPSILNSSLSQLNWISFLSYFFFGVSFLNNYVLLTLLIGVICGAAIWLMGGVMAPTSEIPWFVFHFLAFTLLSSFWVSYELNKLTVKTWQLARGIEERRSELKKKKQEVDSILRNIIPSPYLSYVSSQHDVDVDVRGMHKCHSSVAVLSSDVSNFTTIAESMDPINLVTGLHELFSRFDALTEKYSLEKVKTIGDAYVACSGLWTEDSVQSTAGEVDLRSALKVRNAVEMALDMHEEVSAYNAAHPERPPLAIRVGVHCGHVFSGIVGHSKFQFDVFGHTVSVTDQLERNGRIWAVHVSNEVKEQLDALWLQKSSRDFVMEESCGYRFRELDGKSYLLTRKRWEKKPLM